VAAIIFALSTAFPILASLFTRGRPAVWIGILDVSIALVLIVIAGALVARTRAALDPAVFEESGRLYRAGANVLLVLLMLFFAAGDRIDWQVLLVGLAWRAWLLAYALPAWLAARRHEDVRRV
jgi:hypothetical protein